RPTSIDQSQDRGARQFNGPDKAGREPKPLMKIVTCCLGIVTCFMLALLPGCLNVAFDKKASETTLRQGGAMLGKQYRLCLQKYEDNPTAAKERCGVYRDAIKDLGPEAQRSLVSELLDQIEVKVKQ